MDQEAVRTIVKPAWGSAFFVGVSYVVLCGLIIGAVAIAKARPAGSLPVSGDTLMPWQAVLLILAAVFIGAILIRKIHVRTAWELIMGATFFLGVWFYLWMAFSGEIGLLVASALTLIQASVRRVWIHDVFILMGTAGVALNFAFLFPVHMIVVILVGLAAYDTFGGRPGGPIVRFAASLVHRGIIPGLVIPARQNEINMTLEKAVHQNDTVFLGAGDLILPMLLVARAALVNVTSAVMIAACIIASAGWLGSRGATKPFPALIPLAIASVVPYLILSLLHLV
jgi:presenilin-like A22 family membrane protease